MSPAQIILADVRRQTGATLEDARRAVVTACDNLLNNPQLPGASWSEQLTLEAVRLVKERTRD